MGISPIPLPITLYFVSLPGIGQLGITGEVSVENGQCSDLFLKNWIGYGEEK
jgi:hypothetical protein